MTKRKSKSTKSIVKATAAKGAVKKSSTAPATTATPPLIVLGFDEQQKPRGARFVDARPELVTKAAETMGFKVYEATPPDVAEIAKKLPVGRLYANGRGFVPNVRQDLYSDLVVALALEPQAAVSTAGDKDSLPVALGLPRTWGEIAAGHLVIAQESLDYGWWEAIVLDRQRDTLTLQYRDYPHLPKFVRHRSSIALIFPPDEERRPEASA
jgi:secreted protein with Ig-like and vWFA domain